MIETETSDDGVVDIVVDGRSVSIRAGERSRREILAAAFVTDDVVLSQRIGGRIVPVNDQAMIVGRERFLTRRT